MHPSITDPFTDHTPWHNGGNNSCPCHGDHENIHRLLADGTEEKDPAGLWQIIYTSAVLVGMLIALFSDRVGADGVMITALTLFMAAEIITVKEGLAGFSNEGLLTVIALFVVAHGISVTGALDWYMGKLLGRPSTIAGAQLRLMIPVAIVSAFLNNTPVVAVMIPIVLRWGKNIGVSPQQLLIPLSFATILGGTCTLIGTSTNLVVVGLLEKRYPDDPSLNIGLFDLAEFGVPLAIIGITYILVASPWLLAGGSRRKGGADILLQDADKLLLGARVTQWSPAAGRSVKRSGLRDDGAIFLVSVYRTTTGNVHRAVGQDFVLNVGDVLYFTGLVEAFGHFCEEHALEMVTNETTEVLLLQEAALAASKVGDGSENEGVIPTFSKRFTRYDDKFMKLPSVAEGNEEDALEIDLPEEIGLTAASLMESDETDRMRTINQLTDEIRGSTRKEGKPQPRRRSASMRTANDPAQIVVTTDRNDNHRLVLVGINARDRAGLLLDISKGLLRLNLQLHHTEAAVVGERSLSIWRCEVMESDLTDLEEMWSVLSALLEAEGGIEAVKKRGLRVIRAVVTPCSELIGKSASEVNFRQTYKAAIVAIQKVSDQNSSSSTLSSMKIEAGDVLVLQASDNSPLLEEPPAGFYDRLSSTTNSSSSKRLSALNLGKLVSRFSASDTELKSKSSSEDSDEVYSSGEGEDDVVGDVEANDTNDSIAKGVWRDLQVIFATDSSKATANSTGHQREFLTAMQVAKDSGLARKTVAQAGLTKLPGVVLVSIERPTITSSNAFGDDNKNRPRLFSRAAILDQDGSAAVSFDEASACESTEQTLVTLTPEEPLAVGDILWFSGSAPSVGDLRKIPGLRSFDNDQVKKMNEKVFDRRLVQAVIARKGPLVGKSVREARFRTKYGAAVIAVHREGHRVHDHPGQIKLQAGDVLLLEAGPTFIEKNAENDRSFALLAEVENSAPPRLGKLIPAIVLTVAMLAVYTADVASLLVCALVASVLMVMTGIMSEQEARDAVNWEVYVTIACAFGIGTALVNSGLAGALANFMVQIGEGVGIGDAGLYGAVYFATFLISSILTNNAAAALVFPVAMEAAEQSGADPLLMSYTLMLGASASFMSPFGYQTNLMIYGPGGYTFKDFLYIGGPMQILLWVCSVALLSGSALQSWASWLICFAVFVLVASFRLTNGNFGRLMIGRLKSTVPAPARNPK